MGTFCMLLLNLLHVPHKTEGIKRGRERQYCSCLPAPTRSSASPSSSATAGSFYTASSQNSFQCHGGRCPSSNGSIGAVLTQKVGGRIEVVLGAGSGRDKPGDDRTLLAVLVLQQAPDLGVVGVVLFIHQGHYVSDLIVRALGEGKK